MRRKIFAQYYLALKFPNKALSTCQYSNFNNNDAKQSEAVDNQPSLYDRKSTLDECFEDFELLGDPEHEEVTDTQAVITAPDSKLGGDNSFHQTFEFLFTV